MLLWSLRILLLICSLNIGRMESTTLCDRLYVDHGDETKMPYVQLAGIYKKYADNEGHTIFKHEQRNYYFEYLSSGNAMLFTSLSASKGSRLYIGLRARMKSTFASKTWVNGIIEREKPYQAFIQKWEFYDWQSKSHASIRASDVTLTCIPGDVFHCSS